MKIVYSIAIVMVLAAISSCGLSAEETAAIQKRRDDSIAIAVQQRLQEKQEIQNKIAQLKNALATFNADLDAAKDAMNQLKDFHFLRTNSEREEQVRNQSLKIQHIEEKIEKIKDALSSNESSLANYQ
jgi:chromosome segregation ATPase